MCDYDKCFVFAECPALVPKLEMSVVEERVIMDTGVDPAGVDAEVGGGKTKKAKEIKFPKKKNVCVMERVLVHSSVFPFAVVPEAR